MNLPVKLTQRQKAWAFGSGIATLLVLAAFTGMWALVISSVSLSVGVSLGVMAGAELGRLKGNARADTAEVHYAAAAKLVDELYVDNAQLVERAESVERDLIAVTAEKTKLRAQLDKYAGTAA